MTDPIGGGAGKPSTVKVPITKTCGHCGRPFECGEFVCWCGKVAITDRQMEWIAARFEDCLCPACLRQVSMGVLGPLCKGGE